MSELPGESWVPNLSPMNGIGDVLQGGVGGGSWVPAAQAGPLAGAARPMLRAPGPFPRRFPGVAGLMAMPHLHPPPLRLLELHEQRMFQHYLHTNPLIPTRLLRDIEERRRLFLHCSCYLFLTSSSIIPISFFRPDSFTNPSPFWVRRRKSPDMIPTSQYPNPTR
ncbi:hypothetical protein A6R68_19102 [Neotoma lepida]|uniref:Uncharacterized protein n=1 Tax=Neotoma lepida TaxID=56216 RepID=A0A1A6HIX0_NEOLE|nr:hypothetical protein A6R68_19102 [Neotoma lepida]